MLKVCDLVDVIGILEMPLVEDTEDTEGAEDTEDTEEMGVVIHAITVKKRQLHEIVKAQNPPLSSGKTHPFTTPYATLPGTIVNLSRRE
jgi:hypothetical protein